MAHHVTFPIFHLNDYGSFVEDLRRMWTSYFEMINELANTRFKCVSPADALKSDIETIGCGDASDSLICAGGYARLKRTNGQRSCQLVLWASLGTLTSRGELAAAELNAAR